jgi:hypothetical protein
VIVYLKPSLLGDALLVEPAMTAWSIANGGAKAGLYLSPVNSAYRCLYEHNPAIEIVASDVLEAPKTAGVVLIPDSESAYWEAHRLRMPFAAGYFKQFGLTPDPAKDRLHFKLFEDNGVASWIGFNSGNACICPNARSCMSSVYPGAHPNIKPPAEWWKPIVDFLHRYRGDAFEILNVGAPDGMNIAETRHWTGGDYRAVANRMAASRLVISVETGLLHLAGGISGLPIIFLSSATPGTEDDPSSYFASPLGATVVRSKVWKKAIFDPTEVIAQIKDLL